MNYLFWIFEWQSGNKSINRLSLESCFSVRSVYNDIMETLLEQQRRFHEERERLMDAMTKEMLHPKKTVYI